MAMVRTVTLTAGGPATNVDVQGTSYDEARVLNRTGADEVFVRGDGTAPTIDGNDTLVIPAAIGEEIVDLVPIAETDGLSTYRVGLLSPSALKITVVFS